jgi:RNA polymerase sigma-70 factor (ECF subfamily)
VTVTVNNLKSKTIQTEGETTEFERVFQENWNRVYAVICRIVGDPAQAEDLALETFLRLYRRPPRTGINLQGWLYRVATNLGLNQIRSRKRREQYEIEAGKISLETSPPANPDVTVERAEERQRVRHALAQIKPRSARILVLRHSGLSYAEVAAAEGVSPKSVGTLVARAEQEFEQRYRSMEGSER